MQINKTRGIWINGVDGVFKLFIIYLFIYLQSKYY